MPTYPLRDGTFFRLVPSVDGTTVFLNSGSGFAPPPGCTGTLGPTSNCTFVLPGGTVHILETSSPSLLLMMMPGQGYDGKLGDPAVLRECSGPQCQTEPSWASALPSVRADAAHVDLLHRKSDTTSRLCRYLTHAWPIAWPSPALPRQSKPRTCMLSNAVHVW